MRAETHKKEDTFPLCGPIWRKRGLYRDLGSRGTEGKKKKVEREDFDARTGEAFSRQEINIKNSLIVLQIEKS